MPAVPGSPQMPAILHAPGSAASPDHTTPASTEAGFPANLARSSPRASHLSAPAGSSDRSESTGKQVPAHTHVHTGRLQDSSTDSTHNGTREISSALFKQMLMPDTVTMQISRSPPSGLCLWSEGEKEPERGASLLNRTQPPRVTVCQLGAMDDNPGEGRG